LPECSFGDDPHHGFVAGFCELTKEINNGSDDFEDDCTFF
jgi:hypothetical protein